MITADVDMTGFNYGIRGLIKKVGLNGRTVVSKETGELIKTLVRVSPPKDPAKTREAIQSRANSVFSALRGNESKFESESAKEGDSGVKWYAASNKYLFGVARDSDMRNASSETLRRILYRTKTVGEKTRIIVNFKHPRRMQRAAILTKVLTKKSQVVELVALIKKNVGRLKAGWLVAVSNGPIKLSGANMPPGWVTRHAEGAKGRFIDQLSDASKPTFTIANFAKGIGQPAVNSLVQIAVNIRAKAMQKNALLFMSGKKNLSDYA